MEVQTITPSAPAFRSLPRELRDMIYGLLLTKEDPIPIYSPRSKRTLNSELTSRKLRRLSLVNKQVAAEGRIVFYSKNIWVVGNGSWSSTMQTNKHALIQFIERIPNRYKACIKKIKFEVHPDNFAYRPRTISNTVRELGSTHEALAIHRISGYLIKYFGSLESITFSVVWHECKLRSDDPNQTMSKSRNVIELSRLLDTLLLECGKLKEIRTTSYGLVDMAAAVDRTISKFPGARSILKMPDRTSTVEISWL